MKSFTVGFLGGPLNGRIQAVRSSDDTRPPVALVTLERAPWGVPGVIPMAPAYREVCYRLTENCSGDGPRWVYVHPDVSLPRG